MNACLTAEILRHASIVALVALPCAFLTASCNISSAVQNGSDGTAGSKQIDGYGDLKLGSPFEEAISAVDADRFTPAMVIDCLKDMPLKGCTLFGGTLSTPFQIKDGIPFELSLTFNQHNKLTDIGLLYSRVGDITRAQCLQLHERTLDWLAADYGAMREYNFGGEKNRRALITAGRNRYTIDMKSESQFFLNPMRTVSTANPTAEEKRPLTTWDGKRYVSLLSYFLWLDKEPACQIEVQFREPRSVERKPE